LQVVLHASSASFHNNLPVVHLVAIGVSGELKTWELLHDLVVKIHELTVSSFDGVRVLIAEHLQVIKVLWGRIRVLQQRDLRYGDRELLKVALEGRRVGKQGVQ